MDPREAPPDKALIKGYVYDSNLGRIGENLTYFYFPLDGTLSMMQEIGMMNAEMEKFGPVRDGKVNEY